MAKILVIGDTHFKRDNGLVMDLLCNEILQVIETRKPDMCVHLGDTLDTHERLHIRPVTAASKFILACAERCKVVLLIGNHDRENNSDFQSDVHPFNALKYHPNILVVDHAIWDEEYNFIYVPYVPPGRFREALSTAGWTPTGPQPDHGFAHQEFKGSVDGIFVSEHGDPWSSDMFQIATGHIHQHGILPGIIVVGTPIQHKFGDNPDNALLMIHLKDPQGEGKNRKTTKVYERIPILSVPKKVIVHLHDLTNFHEKIPLGCYVKVFLHVADSEASSIQKDPRYLSLCKTVDMVSIKTTNEKLSLAAEALSTMNFQPQETVVLETVVSKMLEDDPPTLGIFSSEIIG